jgi:hypothetical protein
MHYEAFDPDVYARSLGFSRLPHPHNVQDLTASLQDHYPPELIPSGLSGRVLLSLDLDARGHVTTARAVEPPAMPGVTIRAIVVNEQARERHEMAPASGAHPALKRAAEEAARVLRFAPAERDGKPVAFSDYRLTVEMTPPPSSRHE